MEIYIYMTFFIFFLGLFTDKEVISYKEKVIMNKNIYLFLICGMLFFLSATRYGIGTDYRLYNNIFNSGYEKSLEMGFLYSWISELYRESNLGYQMFLSLNAFIYIAVVYYLIKNYSPYKYVSLLVLLGTYSYFSSMNTFRQFSSIALVIFSLIIFYRNKRLFLVSVLFILSIALHKSSLLYLPLFAFGFIRVKPRIYLIILSICFFAFFVLSEELKQEIFNYFLSFSSFFSEKYTTSTLSVFTQGNERGLNNKLFYFFYWSITTYYIYTKRKTNNELDWIDSTFLFYFIFNSFMPFSTLVIRISYLFDLLSIVMFPRYINSFRGTIVKNIIKILVVSVFVIRMISVLIENGGGVVPYQNIFNLK